MDGGPAEDYAGEEDEDYDEDDDDDEDLMPRALEVEDGPVPMDASQCTTADEYLRFVRAEAQQLPKTVTASVAAKPAKGKVPWYAARLNALTTPASDLDPTQAWVQHAVTYFRTLKADVQSRAVAFAADEDAAAESPEHAAARRAAGAVPRTADAWMACTDPLSTEALVALDHLGAVAAFTALTETMPGGDVSHLAPWAFGLLLRVEDPIDADVQHTMQCLRRVCEAKRPGLEKDEPAIAAVNLLLTVVREVYGQR